MADSDREKLKAIKTFPSLVKYLRDELDWPIDADDFDDLTFDYEPEELGIDSKTAAKIDYIKQLRPLEDRQPWGIFFIKFEPKRLPVVAMRRILRGLAVKKRASANQAHRAAWAKTDLLFISAYGEDEQRHISFAHFHEDDHTSDLPVLRVLGWDGSDTALHIDHVHETLTSKLRWPDDVEDTDTWRENWSGAFTLQYREVITTSKQMAIRLADLAREIRNKVNSILTVEKDTGPMHKLMGAFREALIHDMDEDDFADTYAQTVAYGLLSARISRPAGLTADNLADMVPITSPFLKELMETFLHLGGRRTKLDFDELGISDVVETLREANMEAVLRDFGDRNPAEDPVIHFYELFLKEYDAKKRMQRGVFYTPRPVVSYIVRSVHELLQTEFGLEDGLADTTTWAKMAAKHKDITIPEGTDPNSPFVVILDPATGTATFLVEVIDVIRKTMTAKWRKAGKTDLYDIPKLWNEYVPKHLLPRLHGYELLMAPYAIAHMKIGLKLFETGYKFGSGERARIYLTNALEPDKDYSDTFEQMVPALAHEAHAVNAVKRDQRFTVVIGNPPYAGLSSNMAPWIDGLLKGQLPDGTRTTSYYHINGDPLGERKVWLQDDYVKFIRLSQWLLDKAGRGVHGFITNHGYLDNPTFRGMRWSLMQSFSRIHVLDLHGNLKKKETTPDGRKDVNVFDIQQGVAIGLFVKSTRTGTAAHLCPVRHAETWGDRLSKYDRLLTASAASTVWQEVDAAESFYLFVPFDDSEAGDYYNWKQITEVMPVNVTGIVTARDHFVIDFEKEPLLRRMAVLRDTSVSDETIRREYFSGKGSKKYPPGDSRGWKLPDARRKVRADAEYDKRCAPVLYRPFDERQIYYVPWIIDWPRTEAMPHMLAGENLALITSRMTKGETFRHAQVTRKIVEVICMSPKTSNNGFVFPLYLYPNIGKADQQMFNPWASGEGGRRPNLDPAFVHALERTIGLAFVSDRRGDWKTDFGPEDVLGYIYAIFHSPEYRRRFAPILKFDFPRVPPPGNRGVFLGLAGLGSELVGLHLMESPRLDDHISTIIGASDFRVEKASYSDETVWLDKAKTRGFKGVPEEVWNFHIGGYQVCNKWLKDRQAKGGKNPRPGRVLTDEDIDHYQKIVVALHETIRIMAEIDEVIDQHGGWPDAFITDPKVLDKLKSKKG